MLIHAKHIRQIRLVAFCLAHLPAVRGKVGTECSVAQLVSEVIGKHIIEIGTGAFFGEVVARKVERRTIGNIYVNENYGGASIPCADS